MFTDLVVSETQPANAGDEQHYVVPDPPIPLRVWCIHGRNGACVLCVENSVSDESDTDNEPSHKKFKVSVVSSEEETSDVDEIVTPLHHGTAAMSPHGTPVSQVTDASSVSVSVNVTPATSGHLTPAAPMTPDSHSSVSGNDSVDESATDEPDDDNVSSASSDESVVILDGWNEGQSSPEYINISDAESDVSSNYVVHYNHHSHYSDDSTYWYDSDDSYLSSYIPTDLSDREDP